MKALPKVTEILADRHPFFACDVAAEVARRLEAHHVRDLETFTTFVLKIAAEMDE